MTGMIKQTSKYKQEKEKKNIHLGWVDEGLTGQSVGEDVKLLLWSIKQTNNQTTKYKQQEKQTKKIHLGRVDEGLAGQPICEDEDNKYYQTIKQMQQTNKQTIKQTNTKKSSTWAGLMRAWLASPYARMKTTSKITKLTNSGIILQFQGKLSLATQIREGTYIYINQNYNIFTQWYDEK